MSALLKLYTERKRGFVENSMKTWSCAQNQRSETSGSENGEIKKMQTNSAAI